MRTRMLFALSLLLLATSAIFAQNPILPMWEYIPDGEPYVFEDPDQPGQYRVYLYGSHDNLVTQYCGRDQVVWSAPVSDLSNWRYDGIIFQSAYGADGQPLRPDTLADVLYAPDVTLRTDAGGTKHYYLYPNNQESGRRSMVCESNRPDGPFHVINWDPADPKKTSGTLDFDPAAFVDDDSRAYAYWGFGRSGACELDTDMATAKPGTIIADFIPGYEQDTVYRFFEASSMRKVGDKYVFIYSRVTKDGEFGLPSVNYTLAYAYGDSPLGPLTYGGTLIDGRARGKDAMGRAIPTAYPFGNTHGSLCEINGQWWIFYHRQTGTDEFSRQACVAPVTVKVQKGKGGKVTITEGEFNSEGFQTEGLNPLNLTPAGWACYLTGPGEVKQEYPNLRFPGSYIRAVRLGENVCEGVFNHKIPYSPIVNNTAGSTVGYKYFNWNMLRGARQFDLTLSLCPKGVEGMILVLVGDDPFRADMIGQLNLSADAPQQITEFHVPCALEHKLRGKQSLYLVFASKTKDASLCDLYSLQFRKK